MMDDALHRQRHWHCRRGMLELDVLLHGFFDAQYHQLSEAEQGDFERLLAEPDQTLWRWVFGQATPPDDALINLVASIKRHWETQRAS